MWGIAFWGARFIGKKSGYGAQEGVALPPVVQAMFPNG
jgi:hypothetical protein